MYTDQDLVLASAQGFPLAAGALYTATNVVDEIDLLQDVDVGGGERMFVVIDVNVAPAGGAGALVYRWGLSGNNVSGPIANLATIKELLWTPLYGAAQPNGALFTGQRIVVPIPPQDLTSTPAGNRDGLRFFSVLIEKTGATDYTTQGSFSVLLVKDPGTAPKNYDSGFTIKG